MKAELSVGQISTSDDVSKGNESVGMNTTQVRVSPIMKWLVSIMTVVAVIYAAATIAIPSAEAASGSTVTGACGTATLQLSVQSNRTVIAHLSFYSTLGGISGYNVTVELHGTGNDRLSQTEVLSKSDAWGSTTTLSLSLIGKKVWGSRTSVGGPLSGRIFIANNWGVPSCTILVPEDYKLVP